MSKYKTKWDLSVFYKSIDDPQILKDRERFTKAYKEFADKYKNNKDYLTDVKALKTALDDYNEILTNQTPHSEAFYMGLSLALDQDNDKLKAEENLSESFISDLITKVTFFELNIGKIPKEKQKEFLKEPELNQYKHFLERIFNSAKYQLSDKEEQLLIKISKGATTNWSQMISTFISTETRKITTEDNEKTELPFEAISTLTASQNKKVRKEAALAITDINKTHARTATYEMNSILEYTRKVNELRGAKRPETLQLLADDISPEAVKTMVNTIKENYGLSHKYYSLKAKVLGQKKLSYYEKTVTVGNIQNDYSYEDSLNLIKNTFNSLDKEFGTIAELLINNSQIDVFPQKGKSGGAFCSARSSSSSTFILLNHTNKLNDVLTIAHELGHAINFELMKKQKEINYDIPMSTGESPSTFFESLVLEELLRNSDTSSQKALLHQALSDDVSSIFRQTAAYLFELDLHKEAAKKGFLSEKDINELFVHHMSSYLGPDVLMDHGAESWWVYWSHFRRPFYVYSYASGQLLAKSLLNMIQKDPKDVSKLKYMLSAGMSESPVDIFKNIGMDLTKRDIWESGLKDFETKLEQLEAMES